MALSLDKQEKDGSEKTFVRGERRGREMAKGVVMD